MLAVQTSDDRLEYLIVVDVHHMQVYLLVNGGCDQIRHDNRGLSGDIVVLTFLQTKDDLNEIGVAKKGSDVLI